MAEQVTVGLFVRLEAAEGREDDVQAFLEQGRSLVDSEPDTTAWFAARLGPTTFAIFDVFGDDSGRQAHLNGEVAKALGDNAELWAQDPDIQQLDVVAAKLPG